MTRSTRLLSLLQLYDQVWRLGETDWEETGLIVEGGDRQIFPAPLLTDQMLQCKNI